MELNGAYETKQLDRMGCDPSILNVDRRENNISDGFHCHLKPRRTTAVKLSNLNL